jgi:hypothetical protein
MVPGLPALDDGGMASRSAACPGKDTNILSINGQRRARVSAHELLAVIPRTPRVAIRGAANSNGGGDTIINSHFHNHARMTESEARRTATASTQSPCATS